MLNFLCTLCCFVAILTPNGRVKPVPLPYYFEEELKVMQVIERGENEDEFLPDKMARISKGDKTVAIYC